MKRSTLKTTSTYILSLFVTLFIFLLMIGLDANALLAMIISIGTGVLLLKNFNKKSGARKAGKREMPRLSQEKEQFYSSKGLSKEDIQYFRETMHKAKEQVLTIDEHMQRSGKLRAIENRNNTVALSKALFKDIAKEPQKLHEVDKFLYVHLPSLSDLVVKYVEIENHKAKSKATYDILDKSAQTIDKMCGQIAEDYVRFKKDDIKDLDVEIELAKRTLNDQSN